MPDDSRSTGAGRAAVRPANRRKVDWLGGIRLLVMLVLLGECLRIAFASPRLRVHHLIVEGESRYSRDDVMQLGGVAFGQSILGVNLVRVARGLEAQPPVKRVEVVRQFPQTLKVHIEERTPFLQVSRDLEGASLRNADAGGLLYEAAPERDPSLPLVVLPARSLPRSGERLGEQLLAAVRECRELAAGAKLSVDRYRLDSAGEMWLDLTPSSRAKESKCLQIRLGRSTELREKFRDIRLALDGRPDLLSGAAILNVMCAGRPAYVKVTGDSPRRSSRAAGG